MTGRPWQRGSYSAGRGESLTAPDGVEPELRPPPEEPH